MREYKITENVLQFILGGNSEFTIKNELSGKGCKYHIRKKGTAYFVSVKHGTDYEYAGFMRENQNGGVDYFQGKNGSLNGNSTEISGLMWMIAHANKMDSRISLIHHGRCACCGRTLEDEASIKSGFGPVCIQKMLGRA